jgi:hypothetical protein
MGDRAGAKTIKQMCHYQKWLCYDIKRFHLVEQHLLWNFHYAETPSNISEAVIKKSKGA